MQNVFVCVLFDMRRLCLARVQNVGKMRVAVRIRRIAPDSFVARAVDIDDDFPAVRLRDVKFQNQHLALRPVVVRIPETRVVPVRRPPASAGSDS